MYIEKMKINFFLEKNYHPEDINMLLDFCKNSYVNNKIDIITYRDVLKQLYAVGAHSPSDNTTYEMFKT